MSTGSTKRARKGKGQAARAQKASAAKGKEAPSPKAQARAASREAATPSPVLGEEIPERAWLVASLIVLMAATAFRVYALDLKPMHHDEGVNGFFLTNLLRQGVYHYDPSNYHGPVLYYLTLPVVAVFGLNTFAVRFITAAFGIATVWLVLSLRRYVGAVGALTAAALVAVSPACVFYSRYFIHESLFVFFALGIVVAALRFYETGAARYLLLASASASMLFATKETAFISVGTLALAWLVAWFRTMPDGSRLGGSLKKRFSTGQVLSILAALFVLLCFFLPWVEVRATFATGNLSGYQLATISWGVPNLLLVPASMLVVVIGLLGRQFFALRNRRISIFLIVAGSASVAVILYNYLSLNAQLSQNAVGMVAQSFINFLFGAVVSLLGSFLVATGGLIDLFLTSPKSRSITTRKASITIPKIDPRKVKWASLPVVFAFSLFAFIWVLFYSSLFTNWKGVFWDSFEAFRVWKQTGMSEFHSKPLDTYVSWLWQEEAPILILAVIGTAVALFERRKNRFAVFMGAWAFGLLAAYSLISYKTPWLVLSFVVPLAVVGGYGVQALDNWIGGARRRHAPALAVACVALAVCTYQTVVVNFREYDNDRYIYVYSHTQRQALEMLKEVERAAARAGTKEPGIIVASPEYWPLPWYFRDNSHVGYLGNVTTYYDPQSTLMVIGRKSDNPQEDQYGKLRPVLAASYVEAGTYPLRPGVTLVLFERRDLAGK